MYGPLCILSASRNHHIIWHAFLNWDWPSKDCILPMRGLSFSSRFSFPSTWYSGQTALAFTFDDKSLHQTISNEWHDNISNTYKNILFSSYGSRKEKKMWRRVEERSILKSRSQRLLFEVSWMLSRHIKWIYRTCRFSLDSYWSPWEMAVWLNISCGINTYIITSVLMNRSLAQNSVNECYSVFQRSVLSKRATLKGNNLEKKRVAFFIW